MDYTAAEATKETTRGVLDTVKDKISWDSVKGKFDFSQSQLIEIATYFGIGFFSGFLFKKYFRYLFVAMIILVISLKYFESSGFITFHWDSVQTFLSSNNITGLEAVFYACVDWVTANAPYSAGFGVGFLIGYKVG